MRSENLVKMAELKNTEKLEKFNRHKGKIKIGILGGTFDPIHYAHLATAEFIRDKYDIDKIIFIPSGNPPHKLCITTDKYDRYNMTLLATESNEDFLVSKVEIERKKRTYTIDTLKYLKKKYKNADIYFITGADAICSVIAATRPGISLLRSQETIEKLTKKYNADIITVYVPSLDISSTYIREQLNEGKSIRYLVPENVENYLYENKLYQYGDD